MVFVYDMILLNAMPSNDKNKRKWVYKLHKEAMKNETSADWLNVILNTER